MEDQTSLLQGSIHDDPFEVVMRGYNKRQVDDYVLQCQHHIRDLAQRLALAEQEIARVRAEANAAIERAASKPVHEEVSERLGQILRLANEEAERERSAAAEEISAMHAQALTDTQNLRELAQRETEALRQQAVAETEAQRQTTHAETRSLRERVTAEVETLRQRAEQDAADELDLARTEAERVLTTARETAERDVAEAHAAATEVEAAARAESERLMLAAQERSETLIGDAERRATAVNTVLGARLEVLTSTHRDVVGRLSELRATLLEVLGKEEVLGPFEVPGPAEPPVHLAVPLLTADGYVHATGEVAGYQAPGQHGTIPPAPAILPVWQVPDVEEPARARAELGQQDLADPLGLEDTSAIRPVMGPVATPPAARRLDLTSVPDKTRN